MGFRSLFRSLSKKVTAEKNRKSSLAKHDGVETKEVAHKPRKDMKNDRPKYDEPEKHQKRRKFKKNSSPYDREKQSPGMDAKNTKFNKAFSSKVDFKYARVFQTRKKMRAKGKSMRHSSDFSATAKAKQSSSRSDCTEANKKWFSVDTPYLKLDTPLSVNNKTGTNYSLHLKLSEQEGNISLSGRKTLDSESLELCSGAF